MIIVGLGNPGNEYEKTRHNIGFRVIDEWVDLLDAKEVASHRSFQATMYESICNEKKIRFFKPHTYMNATGRSVRAIQAYYKVDATQIVVVCDELDIPFGRFRFRKKGSAGTHNGLKSIVQELGSDQFRRLRFGVGPRPPRMEASDFVLSRFRKAEEQQLIDLLIQMRQVWPHIETQNWENVMQMINQK